MGVAIAGMHFTGHVGGAVHSGSDARLPLGQGIDAGPAGDRASPARALLIVGVALVAGMLDRLVRARTLEAELRHAMEAAENTSRLKSDFLATMSHEIRTPMSGVLGMLDLSLDQDLTPELAAISPPPARRPNRCWSS